MTDIKKFIKLYKEFGITLEVERINDNFVIPMSPDISTKFVGYMGFASEVVFDSNGKFLSQSFYEQKIETVIRLKLLDITNISRELFEFIYLQEEKQRHGKNKLKRG